MSAPSKITPRELAHCVIAHGIAVMDLPLRSLRPFPEEVLATDIRV